MSRQLDQKVEQQETAKRNALVKALEYGIVGALEGQGAHLLGFNIKYDAWNCLLTIKAVVDNKQSVCFVGSDTIINCFLKAQSSAHNGKLHWRDDQYHTSED